MNTDIERYLAQIPIKIRIHFPVISLVEHGSGVYIRVYLCPSVVKSFSNCIVLAKASLAGRPILVPNPKSKFLDRLPKAISG
jgi:hypothetical protein